MSLFIEFGIDRIQNVRISLDIDPMRRPYVTC